MKSEEERECQPKKELNKIKGGFSHNWALAQGAGKLGCWKDEFKIIKRDGDYIREEI